MGQPVKKYKLGTIEVTKWNNEDEFTSYTINKSYNNNGEWKSTNSFNGSDLATLKELIDRAIKKEINEVDNK